MWVGVTVALTVLASVPLAVSLTGTPPLAGATPIPPSSPSPSSTSFDAYANVKEGECFAYTPSGSDPVDVDFVLERVAEDSFFQRTCSASHHVEVIDAAAIKVPSASAGSSAAVEAANTLCIKSYKQRFGTEPPESRSGQSAKQQRMRPQMLVALSNVEKGDPRAVCLAFVTDDKGNSIRSVSARFGTDG